MILCTLHIKAKCGLDSSNPEDASQKPKTERHQPWDPTDGEVLSRTEEPGVGLYCLCTGHCEPEISNRSEIETRALSLLQIECKVNTDTDLFQTHPVPTSRTALLSPFDLLGDDATR